VQIIVVFRYDDYSNHSPTDLEVRLFETFQRNHIPLTIGVIPFLESGDTHEYNALSSTKANLLRNMNNTSIIEVALHGFNHETIYQNKKPLYSEFAGLDFTSQHERLSQGKRLLEQLVGKTVKTFIPSWNSYDENTIKALELLEFETISASNLSSVNLKNEKSPLKFLPQTCSLNELRRAVKSAKRNEEGQAIIVVLFHAYDFTDVDESRGEITYENFLELLDWLKAQTDVSFLNISQTAQVEHDLTYQRLSKNIFFLNALSLMPLFLQPSAKFLNLTQDAANRLKIKAWAISSIYYFTLLLGFAAFAYHGKFIFIENILPLFILKYIFLSLILVLFLLIASIKLRGRMGHKRALISAVVIGVAIGIGILIVERYISIM